MCHKEVAYIQCATWYTDIPGTDGMQLALYESLALNDSGIAVTKMQHIVDALPIWLKDTRLTVNVAKTQALSLGTMTLPQVKLMEQNIEWSATVKYLGVTIDCTLSMKHHVNNVVAQVHAARSLLRPVLSCQLSLRVKLGVYKANIGTLLTYGAPTWLTLFSETNHRRTRAVARTKDPYKHPRFVRKSTIFSNLRVESLKDFVGCLSTNLFVRADGLQVRHLLDPAS